MTVDRKRKPKDVKFTELQMRLLEKYEYELRLAQSEKLRNDLVLSLMLEKAKNYNNEIEKHRTACTVHAGKIAGKKELRVGFIDTMEKKYQLQNGWGYCPDTGEIKQGDNNE